MYSYPRFSAWLLNSSNSAGGTCIPTNTFAPVSPCTRELDQMTKLYNCNPCWFSPLFSIINTNTRPRTTSARHTFFFSCLKWKGAYDHLKSRDVFSVQVPAFKEVKNDHRFKLWDCIIDTIIRRLQTKLIMYLCTVMEKADVPTRAERVQKFHKGPRPFWENEPVNQFIFYFWSASNLKNW